MTQATLILASVMFFSRLSLASEPPQMADLGSLRTIAADISRSVLHDNYENVLKYDLPALREEHRQDLQNKQSDLYCFLIGNGCKVMPKQQSIHSQFAAMKAVAFVLEHSSKNDYTIIFFDSTKYSSKKVLRPGFLCAHGNIDAPAWTFKWTGQDWQAAHPIFDSEIDAYCAGTY